MDEREHASSVTTISTIEIKNMGKGLNGIQPLRMKKRYTP
jgi:hypothetical protein